VGSTPDVSGFFFSVSNPSIRSMALVLIQPLTKMSTMNVSEGKARPSLKADSLNATRDMWDPRHPITL
jgi:hypothetical protein